MEKNENGLSTSFPEHSHENGTMPRQLAMVYSPFQCWRMLYTTDAALKHGTLFEELNKPLSEER